MEALKPKEIAPALGIEIQALESNFFENLVNLAYFAFLLVTVFIILLSILCAKCEKCRTFFNKIKRKVLWNPIIKGLQISFISICYSNLKKLLDSF
jgi:H+/Cl- antiporter ClcA